MFSELFKGLALISRALGLARMGLYTINSIEYSIDYNK